MAIGFVTTKNLAESNDLNKDQAILNNLSSIVGEPLVASDIQLFSNNLKDVDVLKGSGQDFVFDDDYFVVIGDFKVAFSNGTEVFSGENGDIKLEVYDSNGITKFKLKDVSGNDYTSADHDLIRKNVVTLENIQNLNVERREEVEVFQDDFISFTRATGEGYNDYINNKPINSIENQTGYIEDIQLNFDSFLYIKSFSILKDEPFETLSSVKIGGAVKIINSKNLPPSDENSPGLFITSGDNIKRAFSSSNNPWEKNSLYTETESTKVSVKELKLTNPNFESLSTNSISTQTDLSRFTHKINVNIDGQDYFLLCELI